MDHIADALAGRPIIVGAGLAGLLTALNAAPEPVVVLAKAPLALGAASAWAQGGIAAAVGADGPAVALGIRMAAMILRARLTVPVPPVSLTSAVKSISVHS